MMPKSFAEQIRNNFHRLLEDSESTGEFSVPRTSAATDHSSDEAASRYQFHIEDNPHQTDLKSVIEIESDSSDCEIIESDFYGNTSNAFENSFATSESPFARNKSTLLTVETQRTAYSGGSWQFRGHVFSDPAYSVCVAEQNQFMLPLEPKITTSDVGSRENLELNEIGYDVSSKNQDSETPMRKSEHGCLYCKRRFSTHTSLKTHADFSCSFQKKFQMMCKLCGKKFAGFSSINPHMIRVHGVNKFQRRDLTVKVKITNDDLTADTESNVYINSQNMKLNNLTEIKNSLSKYFHQDQLAFQHATEQTGANNEVIYDISENEFQSPKSKKKEVSFESSASDKKVSNHSLKMKSLAKCLVCKQKFRYPSEIGMHCLKSHNTVNIFCLSCEKAFTNFTSFKYHLVRVGHYLCAAKKTNMGESNTIPTSVESVNSEINSLTCNVCNEGFPVTAELARHLVEHLNSGTFSD